MVFVTMPLKILMSRISTRVGIIDIRDFTENKVRLHVIMKSETLIF